ncbi:peptide/nickel transport system permease protein [Aneurinibacillus soli]|uniref:Dipeptide transport system permease protein DppB n=1 Tax=Aneurinibacillus soli TaxID=1500254 RepID=A0A0U5BDQ7_9BACL|nr:ABC transporter permease [Aneurinibacillus soli]PYE62826.1 peptide/nickel transport system permease protein [Aneurinibacillus soli]BAU29116.1 Dipeptide transport system permease protein DppB [Aneurinibacillus soli]
MVRYTLQRLGWALLTLWVVITVTFTLMRLVPGDPFSSEGKMPPGVYENIKAYYHLDRPVVVQYVEYLRALLTFDFGPSLKSDSITVNDYIRDGFPVSLHLGLQALVIGVTFGIMFGVIAALYHNRWPDYVSMILAIIGMSIPNFILATVLIQYVAVEWGGLPPATWGTWQHTILPSVALALMPMAFIARLMRSSMLEVLRQDYIKTAKAKGLAQTIIIMKHTIRNAILPVVTMLGVIAANLITGSFVIEHIFGIPGMGEMFVKGIFNRDYPVILGSTVFYSAILIFLVLLVDLAYTWIDPRITVTGESK